MPLDDSNVGPPSLSDDDPEKQIIARLQQRLEKRLVGYQPAKGHPADAWIEYFVCGGELPTIRISLTTRLSIQMRLKELLRELPHDQVPDHLRRRLA